MLLEKGQLERLRGEEGKKTGWGVNFGDIPPQQILGVLRVFYPPSSRHPAGARLFQHLEGVGGVIEPGRHEILQQLQERHRHHPGWDFGRGPGGFFWGGPREIGAP